MNALLAASIIVGLLLIFPLPPQTRGILLISLGIVIVAFAIFYLMSKTKGFLTTIFDLASGIKFIENLKQKISEIDRDSEDFFKEHTGALIKIFILTIFQWSLTIVQFKVATLIIGYHASATEILLAIILTGVSTLVPIPAGLGILEASQFSLFSTLGSGGEIGIAISVIIRIKDLILVLLGFIFLSQEGVDYFHKSKGKAYYNSIKR